MSRRLGRPAKRRESQYAGLPADTQRMDPRRHQRDRKTPVSKRKAKEDQAHNKDDEDDFPQSLGETVAYDKVAVDQTMLDDISLDDTNLSTPTFGEKDQLPSFAVNDALDFSSDSWLQEFLSQQGPELAQESDLFDTLALEKPKIEKPWIVMKQGYNDSESSPQSFAMSPPVREDHPPTVSLYSADDLVTTEAVTGSTQCLATIEASCPEYLKNGASVRPQQPSMAEALSGTSWTATEQASLLAHSRVWKRQNDFGFSTDNFSPSLTPVSTGTGRQCQSTIDSILDSQRIVQHLAESILQCALCSKTRVNLLMVVVVSIDSLITTLEVLMSGDGRLVEGVLPELQDHMLLQPDFEHEIAMDGSNRRYTGGVFHFRAEIQNCPLMTDWTVGHHPSHKALYAADAGDICFACKVEHDDGDGSEITVVYDEDENVH
ncbi:uncharacterized protein CDV56_107650 [Aspergillus thermomutatus]|uniref:Uncharacterized protein n=1 Tax=Aspergillus thermomutatus TaxID=41047 RepID=A0A397HKZ0_ASPTH|nr:uncharacterized protein CDV56_107650 [Aspergillus thermomutatus]RHZ63775.1 hypothetical protein CDV56_107650 [Aspergillus thermomutatus]